MGDNATLHKRKYTLDVRTNGDDKDIHPNTGDGCGQQFRPIPEMIKHGAGEYQEITLERFSYETGQEIRIQPSYVVYFKKEDNYLNNDDFKKAIDVAKSFDIPIVIIDIKKVMLNEKREIEELLSGDISVKNIIEVISRYSNIIASFSTPKVAHLLPEIFNIENPSEFINNLLKNYLNMCKSKNLGQEFYQDLFDQLVLINDEKGKINPGLLIKLQKEHNLTADFKKYGEIVFGITYNKQSKNINSQYGYRQLEETYHYIQSCGLELTDEVYDNKNILNVVRNCKTNNIPLTQEILAYGNEELHLHLNKHRTITNLETHPTDKDIINLFELFSTEEILSALKKLLEKIQTEKRHYLLSTIKEKLKENNLESSIEINEEKEPPKPLDEIDLDDWDSFEWDSEWGEEVTSEPPKL